MRKGFLDYVGEAFNARPFGMWPPPNWAGIAAFGLLGILNPGFWLIGAGAELAFLSLLVTNRRFTKWVDGKALAAARASAEEKLSAALGSLDPARRRRFEQLKQRCLGILQTEDFAEKGSEKALQAEGLERVLWIAVRLLRTQQSLELLAKNKGSSGEDLQERLSRVSRETERPDLDENLRRSLSGQREILERRIEALREAGQKLAFTESEITRIEEQVKLIEDQTRLATDPAAISGQIDGARAALDETSAWIQAQQRLFGGIGDFMDEPPQVLAAQTPSQTRSQ